MTTTINLKTVVNHDLPAIGKLLRYSKNRLFNDVKKDMSSQTVLDEVHSIVDYVVQTEIYEKWPDPGTRTGSLRRSFKVMENKSGDNVFTVFSDSSDAPIKSGKYEGSGSYGIFFLKPEEFKSFIGEEGSTSQVRYRPFFEPMVREVKEKSIQEVLRSIRYHVEKRIPGELK